MQSQGKAAQVLQERNSDFSAPVVIVGIDDERGVHVARTMARHGIKTIAFAKNAKSVGARTRTCRKILVANTDSDDVINKLVELGESLTSKAVLIPCFDTVVSLISQHRDRLAGLYHLALPHADTIDLIRDKARFYEFAEANDYVVPRTVLLRGPDDLNEVSRQLRFPCIIKPADSKSPRWQAVTHIKAFLADNETVLRELYERYRDAADILIVQEMVEGDDSSIYTCLGYYNAQSKPLIEFTSRKLRQWPPRTGVGCLAEEVRQDEVRETARRLLKQLQFRGLCSLEMKQDACDGKFYVIEANVGRPTGRSAHAEACGVELLLTLYCDAQGLPPPEQRIQSFERRKWINIRRDAMSSLSYWWRGELKFLEWWRSIQGDMSYALFSWRDPGPFLGEITNTFRRALKKLFRK